MTDQLFNGLKSLLCPPGNGVFTVNTAKERKNALHEVIYGVSDSQEKVENAWLSNLEKISNHDGILLTGICSDCGGGILRGANWGPLFLRSELYKTNRKNLLDIGDVRVIPHLLHDKYLNSATLGNCRKALYGKENSEHSVSPLSISYEALSNIYDAKGKTKVFAFGGDHSVSYPLVKSYLEGAKKRGKKAALLHFDAHTDLLVERLGIDLCFGSWVTHILDQLEDPSLAVQVGIRSSGKPKSHWEKTFGVIQYWSDDVNQSTPDKIADKIIEHYKSQNVEELYISFDIDALDSQYASATGTPEEGGLSPDQCARIIDKVTDNFELVSADMVEVAPFLNTTNGKVPEPDTTVMFATSLTNLMLDKMS